MFDPSHLAAAALKRFVALLLLMAAFVSPAAAIVTLTGSTPTSFSGSGQTITFHFRLDQENAIITSLSLGMNYAVSNITCTPALPIDVLETTNCNATYVTQAGDTFDITQFGTYSLTTNGAPRSGSVIGQVTVAYAPSASAPTITSISPSSGPAAGGTSVTITGTNFVAGTSVTIGGVGLLGTNVVNATTITGTTPANTAGAKTVSVTNASGTDALAAGFTYIAPPTILLSPTSLPGATAGVPYAETVTASGGAIPYTFSLTAGALPSGITLSSAGVISGTPLVSGTFNFTVTATDGNSFTGSQAYSLAVSAPTIAVAPSSLPNGTGGAAYSQTLTASGGTGPYTFSIAGALPAGLSLSSSGVLSGTPTVSGSFNFTVTATDALGFTGSQAYALTVDAPGIAVSPAGLPNGVGGVAYAQNVSATGGTAPYTFAITAGALPAGLALAANGSLSGTPTAAGSFPITVMATDTLGFTGSQAYTLTVDAPGIAVSPAGLPNGVGGVAYAQNVSATGGTAPYTFAITAGALPAGLALAANGSISGTPTAAGSFPITVTALDANGFSGTASYSLTIGAPVPVAASRTVDILAGTSATISLTDGASGSPFTGAAIVGQQPAAAGTATIAGSGGSFDLVFLSSATASGAVIVSYTLSNAWGVSAPATITFNVVERPDPSKDPEVIGLLTAQVDSARRLAANQIHNFNDRLEQLHDEGDRRANSIDIQVGVSQQDQSGLSAYAEEQGQDGSGAIPFGFPITHSANAVGVPDEVPAGNGKLAFWTGGFVNFGTRETSTADIDQTLVGVSGGMDYRFSSTLVGGIGIGYGRDVSDVGSNGTENEAQAVSAAVYGSYHPLSGVFIDGLLGFSRLEFDSRRFVTDTGDFADGSRDGHQFFGSLSAGYEHRRQALLLSPYARLEAAWSRLDAFTETGAGTYNLAFGDQDAEMVAGVLGLRMEYRLPTDWGAFVPRGRLEYTHDFAGSSQASMGYADLSSGLPYVLDISSISRDYLSLEAGVDAEIGDRGQIGIDYRLNLGLDGDGEDHAFRLKFSSAF